MHPDAPTHDALPPDLDAIYALGERIRTALAAGDVDAFADLVRQRGALVAQWAAAPAAPAVASPRAYVAAWARQHQAIVAAATEQERHLAGALDLLERLKQAHAHYADRPPAAGILHKDLHG